jgi:hypothetical protein
MFQHIFQHCIAINTVRTYTQYSNYHQFCKKKKEEEEEEKSFLPFSCSVYIVVALCVDPFFLLLLLSVNNYIQIRFVLHTVLRSIAISISFGKRFFVETMELLDRFFHH